MSAISLNIVTKGGESSNRDTCPYSLLYEIFENFFKLERQISLENSSLVLAQIQAWNVSTRLLRKASATLLVYSFSSGRPPEAEWHGSQNTFLNKGV